MAESTLSAAYADIAGAIGHYLGYGRGTINSEGAWTTQQSNDINSYLKSGYHRALFPILPDNRKYEWSFMKPTASLSLVSGESSITLPDDFGGLTGNAVITSPSGSSRWWPVQVRNEAQLTQMQADWPDRTGRPECVAIKSIKGTTSTEATRFTLAVFPEADQNYTLAVQYTVLPDQITQAAPYAYGGMWMRELMLASCLAVAEVKHYGRRAEQTADYERQLVAAVDADRRLKGQLLGYNGDNSDRAGMISANDWYDGVMLSINGVLY